MPTTTQHIATTEAADTTALHDSVAAVPVFVPKYPSGLPDTIGNNLPVMEVSKLPLMVTPKENPGEEYLGSYELGSGIMLLTIISFLLITFSFRRGVNYFFEIMRNPFSVRTRENAFEDRTINETFFLTTLISNTCIVQGILIYYALEYLGYINAWEQRVLLPVLLCIGVSAFYYTFQLIFYKILGYVFGTPEKTKIWIEGYNSSQAALGIVLIPIALMLNIHAGEIAFLLICGLILFILLRILFICKGFRIFFNKIKLQVYFILYLCAVEFVPIVFGIIGAIYICNVLQA